MRKIYKDKAYCSKSMSCKIKCERRLTIGGLHEAIDMGLPIEYAYLEGSNCCPKDKPIEGQIELTEADIGRSKA